MEGRLESRRIADRQGCRERAHNLKHTLGHRLRSVCCPIEIRKVLPGHRDGDITTHYSAAELEELLIWLERVTDRGSVSAKESALLHSVCFHVPGQQRFDLFYGISRSDVHEHVP